MAHSAYYSSFDNTYDLCQSVQKYSTGCRVSLTDERAGNGREGFKSNGEIPHTVLMT